MVPDRSRVGCGMKRKKNNQTKVSGYQIDLKEKNVRANATSFPGSLILLQPPPPRSGKMRDPGSEVGANGDLIEASI